MSNEKMREALVTARAGLVWYQETYPETFCECDNEALEQIDAALAQQSEPSQVSQEPVAWMFDHNESDQVQKTYPEYCKKFFEPKNIRPLYSSPPPDYEALKAENARLLSERDSWAKELTDKVDYWYDEAQTLKLRVAEWQRMYETNRETIDKLQSECDQLRNRPFECWSNDDGDSWCEHPADSEFVGGLKVGDTFELLAGYDSVRVKYVVTKAPDDVDDEYEVERAK